MIKSKSKKLKNVIVPVYTKDRELVMLPINLAGGNVLPDEYKEYLPLVKQMIKESPVKSGIAYLTIHEKKVSAGLSQRRGGEHIDGNYLPNLCNWGSGGGNGWKVGENGNSLNSEEHHRSYCVETGGMLVVSNHSLCKGWNGDFDGEVGIGGDASSLKEQLKADESFLLEPSVLYLANSQFIHESLPTNETIKRVFVRITLPETSNVL